jgi:ribonuclease-3
MSQTRLHQQLLQLFSERNSQNLILCLEHPDFISFETKHSLQVPLSDLVLSFTHTSFSHEYEVPHQELSEFFGDAVVQLIVTAELMRLYPNEKEGRLSRLRSFIVNEKTLARVANGLQLSELILVGKGEFKKELHLQDTVLSDTLEALMSTIFQHHGLDVSSKLLLKWLYEIDRSVFSMENLENYDAKSKLQEATLAKYKTLPRYQADTHADGFLVKVLVNEEVVAEGVYSSKKIGERELARQVLENKVF